MVAGDHAPNFPLKHSCKDMTLARAMAKKAGVEFTVNDQAEALYRKAKEDTELNVADEDFSAIYKLVQKESTDSRKRKAEE